jgi:hypothetical protein
MKRITAIACWSLAATFMTGCAFDATLPQEAEALEEAESQLVVSNALNPNALNPNALNPNALNPYALNPNALSLSALQLIQDPGSSGDLSRQLLKYTVSCALNSTQSFSFSWTDTFGVVHPETYSGLLGLAADWATTRLSPSGAEWVSACLASRVNWYGATVTISSRGPVEQLSITAEERADYPHIEGAFFGNLFTSTPALYSCYNLTNVDNSRSQQRDCAAGHVNPDGSVSSCGILQILGSCSDYCSSANPSRRYYSSCFRTSDHVDSPTSTVVTTALP